MALLKRPFNKGEWAIFTRTNPLLSALMAGISVCKHAENPGEPAAWQVWEAIP